jgi:RNA polymerase sigma factor (sigma-70 family)
VADRSRFEQIYDDYSGLILAYAARRTRDPDDAADVVAETFMVAWRRIDAVPPGDEARPWLYGIARRVLANRRRSLDRRSRLDSKLRAVASRQPALTDDDATSTIAALDRLRESDRELLTLTAWDGDGAGSASPRPQALRRNSSQRGR